MLKVNGAGDAPHMRDLMTLHDRDLLLAVQVRLLGVQQERARPPSDQALHPHTTHPISHIPRISNVPLAG